jgi:hypothetical protein
MNIVFKIKKRIFSETVRLFRKKPFYPIIYRSYWHFIFHNSIQNKPHQNYFTGVPNEGAGIGHQIANWIAGYWYSKQFNLKFAHIPFSSEKWEQFLGFGEGEIFAEYLIQKQKYKKVLLPLFDEFNEAEVKLVKNIINSYSGKKVLFVAEQDQFYKNQYGNIEELKQKFYSAKVRINDELQYDQESFNIAIHVRRGDIVVGKENKNPNLQMRWQNNDYFEKVLNTVLDNIKTNKTIVIYLFSQGKRNDFPEFEKFKNIHFCLEMSAQASFLHMVYADLLITSKSSFSYKPALLSKGIKVCPSNFWHGYPNDNDWILANDNGIFNVDKLTALW